MDARLEKLKELSKDIHLLNTISMLLNWDQETYMPKGAISVRSSQIALIAGLQHEKQVSPEFKQALEQCAGPKLNAIDPKFNEEERAMVREWLRDYQLAAKLPKSFIEEFALTTSKAVDTWAKARKDNRFGDFAPHLEKILEMIKKRCDLVGYKEHPYDALIEEYEPGMTTAKLKEIFDHLKGFLVPFIQEISKSKQVSSLPPMEIEESALWKCSRDLLDAMGLDKSYSRLDHSEHPFCISDHPHDVRLTTHIDRNDFLGTLSAVLHEGGHALYQLGLPEEMFGTPLSCPISMAVHESQSRFWETYIGSSHAFFKGFLPLFQQAFPALKAVGLDQIYRSANHVQPSFIRIHSDEVTYCLHIILRFELELALIEGSLSVKELPAAWNRKMVEYLGIEPKSDKEGCLQDIHWSAGLFGYFPTYALGNIYAGQWYHAFTQAHPDWQKRVEKQEMHFIRDWLCAHIHRYGKRYLAHELIKKVTGEEVSPDRYLVYLKGKYAPLYKNRAAQNAYTG